MKVIDVGLEFAAFLTIFSIFNCINCEDQKTYPNRFGKARRDWLKDVPKTKLATDVNWIQETLDLHNYYRKFHDALPLKLNLTLCEVSQSWANERARGLKGHNPNRVYLGENIYTFGVSGIEIERRFNTSIPIDAWYREVSDYNFGTCQAFNNEIIGHFTQLVWKDSREYGAAYTSYYDKDGWDWIVVVANYYPAGNVPGLFQDNVTPRKELPSGASSFNVRKVSTLGNSAFMTCFCLVWSWRLILIQLVFLTK